MKNIVFVFLVALISMIYSCVSGEDIKYTEAEPVVDIDGNIYPTIEINGQIWMAENLTVLRFQNGDTIKDSEVTSMVELRDLAQKSASWKYNFLQDRNYGNLYGHSTVIDPRELAPKGWHIATRNEWEQLIDYLGGEKRAPLLLKSIEGWEQEGNGTNKSGFNALPSGLIDENGKNSQTGYGGFWWDTSGYTTLNLNNIGFGGLSSRHSYNHRILHKSIRCVKDGLLE